MSQWNEVTQFLAQHHGVVDRKTLDRLEVARHQLHRWVTDGRLDRIAPRVWRLVGSPPSIEQRLMAGLLALGPSAMVSHEAAARLHGFDRTPPDRVEFLVPRANRNSRLGETVHCSHHVRPIDAVTVDGFRVTSATRTILDLANIQVSPVRLQAAIDSAIRMQLSAPAVIAKRMSQIRRRGRTGVCRLDELIFDTGGHTMLERNFLRLMREAGLPRPVPQVVFKDDERTIARVDFLYREWSIVVEVSGRLGHSTPTERARDAQRRNELQDLGLRVYEFTWEDVTERGKWVQAEMRCRLKSAGWPSQHGFHSPNCGTVSAGW